ncbi:RsiW-degrading membrane proteinase PrsW (M82 family) [Actinoplanes lutulentus]|uniref:RsiW-degrading membrane proteinase PrsW (M82 family) n=1 Tax=Actinoplanes lutulentus TaxID=1287878 RepID=A0A327ZGN2_9ACTN|nr:PrsW family intramembrane metalloprotease [Actinoplanes lutulentus]MBB2944941.1 RsiW-degrading membrane proteinase PrsW (M82 family) [Actinoplanes lutulentus]RAK35271.1 RsiW-degrading membrane proteinase PrsW (M82 family) [Actinoplanes lutulentus]
MGEPVRPGGVRAAALVRNPAFWVVIALLVAGAVRIAQITWRFFEMYPIATLTAAGLFALLAVPFWLFVSELDFLEREPPSLRVVAFAWGGLVATTVSIPASTALDNLIAKLGSPGFAADWGAALAGPTVEEIAKTLGVVAIVLIARAQVNSVLDGVVYGALVGLGFQIVEDVVFAIGAVALAGQGDQIQPVITTFLVRGFLAGVWSHTLFGALAGAGIGYLVVNPDRTRRHRIGMAALALFGAWASHVLWNSPLFRDGLGNGALALLAVLVFKGLPPLLLILYLVRRAHDREAAYYVAKLATLRDPTLITENELKVLGSGSRRAAARRHAAAQAGRRARATVRRLQRAQARLAVDLSRSEGMADTVSKVREHRARLEELGHPEAVEGTPSVWHTVSAVGTTAVAIAVVWVALSALGGG